MKQEDSEPVEILDCLNAVWKKDNKHTLGRYLRGEVVEDQSSLYVTGIIIIS